MQEFYNGYLCKNFTMDNYGYLYIRMFRPLNAHSKRLNTVKLYPNNQNFIKPMCQKIICYSNVNNQEDRLEVTKKTIWRIG